MAKTKVEEKSEAVDLTKIKGELTDYINLQMRKEFEVEIERVNKKLIREKNKKILFRNIIILLLLCFSAFEFYLLYKSNYFNKFFTNNEHPDTVETGKRQDEQVHEEPALNDLKKQYGYLIDNITISDESDYINEYYSGNLTEELRKYIVLNNMNIEDLTIEDDYNVIDEITFKEKYNTIFESYSSGNFSYNGNRVRYINKLESYITDKLLTNSGSNIKREIVDIKLENDIVKITTIEGLVKDNKIYNILSNDEVGEYNDKNLMDYEDKLNKVTYSFDNGKLIDLK